MSTLSGSVPKSAPGLPRGRTSLDPSDVTAHQRARLLRAVVSAVADKGFQQATIADIVKRARVSRAVMYREFDSKLDCFLAAIDAGRALLTERLEQAVRDAGSGPLEAVARAVSRMYLQTCVQEPDHTRAWVLELGAAGPKGIAMRTDYLDRLAALVRSIDERYGGGTDRVPGHYIALVGGLTELVARQVHAGAQDGLLDLEDTMTAVLVTMLH
ncbi:hypothetical protein BA059_10445 [Mycolicibacterium sp. (ex Dasyatis americana)]|uniref:TetR/AcrR family transcriptional regulator n=1 Tax=Mycobacterium sp. DBP42 TaxID=2545267 RepID=UPI0008732899|nr:TetR/AcrR family transcriptional regulator [Mycobacterium sp. DBP42]OFB40157.1 hypothetical protein BA059_10445 [Mycolicibacterium sp. (ex Dasyatis americana)]